MSTKGDEEWDKEREELEDLLASTKHHHEVLDRGFFETLRQGLYDSLYALGNVLPTKKVKTAHSLQTRVGELEQEIERHDERFVVEKLRETRVIGKEQRRGLIHVYTGDGAGKTSAALGRALRAVGGGEKVLIVQFLKGWKTIGEYKIAERLGPEYEIHQFGTTKFVNLENPSAKTLERAEAGLEYVRERLRTDPPDVLVLDEINYACGWGLLKTSDVLEVLDSAPENCYIILTGRRAPPEFIERATIASEIVDLKERGEYEKTAQRGVEL